jgi:hypothetical protein
MGMNTPAHLKGYKRFEIAMLARCSMAVCEDRRMIFDSARTNSKRVTMLGMDRQRKRA